MEFQPIESKPEPFLSHAEPVLAVHDVVATVSYWHEVLGFPNQWTWGSPPNHGGVSWHGAMIQFTLANDPSAVNAGQSVWLRVKNINALYHLHQERKADIVVPLTRRPYGFDEYIVRDNNGHFIAFASPASSAGKEAPGVFPRTLRIVERKSTVAEHRKLCEAVGWSSSLSDEMLQKQLDTILVMIVAENSEDGELVGSASIFGDGFSFYYVKDVMVHPAWQRKRIGSEIMKGVKRWLDANAPDKALVGLFTGEMLADFYRQTDFGPAFGMIRIIDRSKL